MVKDTDNPEYFEDSFPRDNFPQYLWTERPANLPEDVWTTETTHRDGQQGGLPLSTEQSNRIYDIMCEFAGESGALRQAEFFVYRDSDKKALEYALEKYKDGAPVEPTTWIRASKKDVELIKQLGVKESGMLASASDYHTFHKFKPGGRKQAADIYLEAVQFALDAGIRPRLHLEDATRASMEFIEPFVEAAINKASGFGPELQPKIRVCDTMGVGLPYENIELPRSIPKIFERLRALGLTAEQLEFHPHNDTWMIVPNCMAALLSGCSAINGTCLGKGERSGNAPIEAVLLHMMGLGFFKEKMPNFEALNGLVELYDSIGHAIAPKYPMYGRDAHRTRAGIHADGLNKFWWMYAPFNVPGLLGRPLEVSLTGDSGIAGLQFLVKQHLHLDVPKDDSRLINVNDWIMSQFKEGRQTAIEWEEIEDRVKQALN